MQRYNTPKHLIRDEQTVKLVFTVKMCVRPMFEGRMSGCINFHVRNKLENKQTNKYRFPFKNVV